MTVRLVAQHEAEHPVDHSGICRRTTDIHVGDDADVAFAHDLHELHQRVALRAERFDTDAIRLRFRTARGANSFGFAQRLQTCGFGLARGLFDVRVRLQFSDVYALFG